MSEPIDQDLSRLSSAAGRLGAALARPKGLATICVIALAGLGWLVLGVMTSGRATLDTLCRPLAGSIWSATGFAIPVSMWSAMTLATMLPSAAPMILTYAEIADTAARKGERIVSPFTLTAGYAVVWLGFAATAALTQFMLTRAALLDADMTSASGLLSGILFIAAGGYQFSALKHACLTQCQRPFPFFFSHWTTTRRGVLRLGLTQGLYCLGCCWAMMLLMFAVGVMNILWMAALGMAMTVEKIGAGKRFSHALGALSITLGAALMLNAFAAHWPTSVN
jgi:predicted metal-binding membrane protein